MASRSTLLRYAVPTIFASANLVLIVIGWTSISAGAAPSTCYRAIITPTACLLLLPITAWRILRASEIGVRATIALCTVAASFFVALYFAYPVDSYWRALWCEQTVIAAMIAGTQAESLVLPFIWRVSEKRATGSKAVKGLPIVIAYCAFTSFFVLPQVFAIWMGGGVFVVAAIAAPFFQNRVSPAKACGFGLLGLFVGAALAIVCTPRASGHFDPSLIMYLGLLAPAGATVGSLAAAFLSGRRSQGQ